MNLPWNKLLMIGYAVSAQTGANAINAQEFPSKPIRIVASEVGGAGDIAARIIAQGITGPLGQPVIVDNRGGGVIPGSYVAKAQPDGYTILLHGSGLWLLPFMRDGVPWDALRDFTTVTQAVTSPNLVVVHPSQPIHSIKDLIAVARAKPGQLNEAGGQSGTATHLSSELFKAMTGVEMVRIPYKGVGPALTALAGGEVQVSFTNPSAAAPHVKGGRIRALAVTSAQPYSLLPALPTVASSGLAGYEAVSILGIFAPAKTPATIVNRLSSEISRHLNLQQTKERFLASGVETVGNTPEQFGAIIKAEMARMGKVIRERGIRAE